MAKIKTLFIGTGVFAVPVLQGLLNTPEVEIVGVVTQPDQPVGREQILAGGPVKQFLQNETKFPPENIFQPEKLRLAAEEILAQTNPELIIVASYGQMVPDLLLNTPRLGCLNIHGSLLPELRGAVPVQMALLQGLTKTGVTIQRMVKELDAGPILAQAEEMIMSTDTTASLMARLAVLGRDLLLSILPGLASGTLAEVEQNHTLATFCHKADVEKEKAEITFETDAALAERMVRAFYPWPVAWFKLEVNGKPQIVKVFSAAPVNSTEMDTLPAGSQQRIFRVGKRLLLRLSLGALELLELQLEGKVRRNATEYLFLGEKA